MNQEELFLVIAQYQAIFEDTGVRYYNALGAFISAFNSLVYSVDNAYGNEKSAEAKEFLELRYPAGTGFEWNVITDEGVERVEE